MSSKVESAGYNIQSVSRCVAILGSFTIRTPEWSITDLSAKLGLNRTTCFRLASNLEAGGLLARSSFSRRYRLGLKMLEWGAVALAGLDLRQVAHEHLVKLTAETGESSGLAIYDRGEVLYIDRVESERSLRAGTSVGGRVPIYRGSSGKVLMAYLDAAEREAVLTSSPLPHFTARTITDPDLLRAELDRVRLRGFAIDDQEVEDQLACISVPVFGGDGRAAATVSVSGPVATLDVRSDDMVERVIRAGEAISAALGHSIRIKSSPQPDGLPA